MIKFFGKQNIVYLILGMVLLVHVLILTKLIYFPYPELFIYPYLTNHGLKPYSQILDQHFPGLMFLPINLDNLGMHTPAVARIWSISIVLIIHIMLFLVSREILKSKTKALLVNILYLIWQPFFEGWVLWIDSFLPLFLLPAFYALYKKWIFTTGFLLGIGIIFKQVLVPLSLLVLYFVVWESKKLRMTLRYILGLSLPIFLMLLFFYFQGNLPDFWYWAVVFNLTIFAKYGRKFAPTVGHILRVALVFGVSGFALRFWNDRLVRILIIFLLGALATAISRFDFVHFQPALPFALIATVYGLGRLGGLWRLGIITVYGLVLVWWLIIFYKGHLGDRVISFDLGTKDLAGKITRYTNSGEKIFVYGAAPHLYQMSGTLPAGDIFVFQFPWFLKVSQNRIMEGIKRDKPNIVVSDRTVEIEGLKITDYAYDIDQYIQQNYQRIDKVGTTDILRLNKL